MSVLVIASTLISIDVASAQTYNVLHTFPSCSSNAGLFSALVEGADHHFYGTTNVADGIGGTIYKISPTGDVTVLHTFVGAPTDGSNPTASLVLAGDGNFYGTTAAGGSSDGGTLFRMTPGGVVTIVHMFAGGSADGWNPSTLIQATDGNLYGITASGGAHNAGTAFRITVAGELALLYSFAGGSADGSNPTTLIEAADGTFYGMTSGGGATDNGTVFRMTSSGTVTFLFGSFPGVMQSGSSFFGSRPGGDLVQGSDGNFYGTIHDVSSPFASVGTVFKITPDGTFTNLVNLPGQQASPLIQATDGNMYGVAFNGYSQMNETLPERRFFRLTPGGVLSILHYATETGCISPSSAMTQGTDGKLYGTTGAGVVYRLGVPPTVSPMNAGTIIGRTVRFTAHTLAGPEASFQWQVWVTGATEFTNIVDGGPYSGATTATLSVTPAVAEPNRFTLRAIVTGASGSESTDFATLAIRNPGVVADLNGDGRTELLVFRPGATINWLARSPAGAYGTRFSGSWGLYGDVPVAGDYDADGVMDFAVYRPANSTWYVSKSSDPMVPIILQWGMTGDLPVPGDYDGDGQTDVAVFRPSTGVWFVTTSSSNYTALITYALGEGTDVPVPSDYDGDGKTDVAVYRPSTHMWFIRNSGSDTALSRQWGLDGDTPVPGDYDGDRRSDIAVYRPNFGVWAILLSTTNYSTSLEKQWGIVNDIPVPGDYDADARIDPAVFRPSNATWYILRSSANYSTSQTRQFGESGDVPVPNATVAHALAAAASGPSTSTQTNRARLSDFDRDGTADLTVYPPSIGFWNMRFSSVHYAASGSVQWGLSGDRPVPADYDGDGTTDVAVYRPHSGTWYVMRSSTSFSTSMVRQWGLAGDVPAPADYDGDGKTDPAVYRPANGVWYILKSSTNYAAWLEVQWGLSDDVPVPGDYDGDALTDLAVYRPSTGEWFIKHSRTGYTTSVSYQWGLPGDSVVPGEYDGDGRTDLAVFRPSTGQWFVKYSRTGYGTSSVFQWGLSGDVPVPSDFDSDGKTDYAVWRPSTGEWYLMKSSSNNTSYDQLQWGLSADIPTLKHP